MAESLSNEEGQYSTIELYFSRPDYHILVEEVNSLSQLPLGMRTYFAPSVSIYYLYFSPRVTSVEQLSLAEFSGG